MNAHRKTKIALLAALLVLVIFSGCFFLFRSIQRTKSEDLPPINGTDSTALEDEAQDETYYIGEAFAPIEYNKFDSNIQQYGELTVTFDGTNVVEFGTKKAVFTLPESIVLPDFKLEGLCFDADKNIGCVYYDSASQTAFFQQWDTSGMPIGERVVLQDINLYLSEYKGKKYLSINKMKMDNEYVYIMPSGKSRPTLLVYDRAGAINVRLDSVDDFDIDDAGKLYVASETLQNNEHGYACISADKGTMDYFGKSKYYVKNIALDKSNGIIYAESSYGVETYSAKDGAFIGEAINWIKDSASGTSEEQWLEKFAVDKLGSIYFIYTSIIQDNTQRLDFIYRLAEDSREEIAYTLTLQAPYRTDGVANAIAKFEKANPLERIKYNYDYLDYGEFYQNRTEYSNKLALNLISGDSADIVVLGSSRVNYLEMLKTDVFMDLTKLIKQDSSYKALDKSVLDAMKVDGAIRALPITHNFPLVHVNTALLKQLGLSPDFENMTWSGFLDLVWILEQKNTDVALLTNYDGGSAIKSNLNRVIMSNLPDLIDSDKKTIDLRQKWFVDLMEKWKKASQNTHMSKNIKPSVANLFQGQTLFFIDIIGEEIAESTDGDLFARHKKYNDVAGQEATCVPIFKGEKNANRTGSSENLFAISNASKNKEAAWKFLSFAMTSEVQGMKELRGRPLNKAVRAERMQKAVDNLYRQTDASEYTQLLDGISSSIDYMYVPEGYWQDLVNPLQDYVDDKITLDEALKTAEHDIWIRLNE